MAFYQMNEAELYRTFERALEKSIALRNGYNGAGWLKQEEEILAMLRARKITIKQEDER
jgi:hypothetical protein